MRDGIFLKACLRSNKATLASVALMSCMAAACAVLSITLAFDGRARAAQIMDDLGYGDITVWVEGTDASSIVADFADDPMVEDIEVQPLVFSPYATNDFHSDDEGQIIAFSQSSVPYRFLDEKHGYDPGRLLAVERGTVYVSPAMIPIANVRPGDTIRFQLSRTGETLDFVVVGYFEDGFMGSSMVDMKSFLVSDEDFSMIEERISDLPPGSDAAKLGFMLHVTERRETNQERGAETRLQIPEPDSFERTAFSHTHDSMLDYQLLQQNIVAGFLLVLAMALALVVLVVCARAAASTIEESRHDIAALKTIGYSSSRISRVHCASFGIASIIGCAAGIGAALCAMAPLSTLLVTATGMNLSLQMNVVAAFGVAAIFILVPVIAVAVKMKAISDITPLRIAAVYRKPSEFLLRKVPLEGRSLEGALALKSLSAHFSNYVGIFATCLVLTLFVCGIARLTTWVGQSGEGLMEAFSAADHDIGIQPLGPMDIQEAEDIINQVDTIEAVYALAMQPVSAGNIELTANVIDNTAYFHVIEGEAPQSPEEVVLTSMAASALSARIGDEIVISGDKASARYRVSGIYLCANEMGNNLGMSMQGYERIGNIEGYIWCFHYILSGGADNQRLLEMLTSRFGLVAAIHSNSWSGLSGLVAASRLLLVTALLFADILVFIAVTLSNAQTIASERKDIAIEKMLGMSSMRLRRSFILRISLVSLVGALAGVCVSIGCADETLAVLLRSFGIGSFHAPTSFLNSLAPLLLIVLFAAASSCWASRRIRSVAPLQLIVEE